LWAAAAKLARRDGVTTTARVLGVDRPSLYKWTDRLEPRASGKEPRKSGRGHRSGSNGASAFVELLAASTGTATSCMIRFVRSWKRLLRGGGERLSVGVPVC
jgi:transposase-like protein